MICIISNYFAQERVSRMIQQFLSHARLGSSLLEELPSISIDQPRRDIFILRLTLETVPLETVVYILQRKRIKYMSGLTAQEICLMSISWNNLIRESYGQSKNNLAFSVTRVIFTGEHAAYSTVLLILEANTARSCIYTNCARNTLCRR